MAASSLNIMLIPLIPLLQVLAIAAIPKDNLVAIGRVTKLCWLSFLGAIATEILVIQTGQIEAGPFLFDRLSGALMILISLISLIVHHFSVNYMQAERDYKGYFISLGLLTTVLLVFVSSANIWLLALSWTCMSALMLRLLNQPRDNASRSAARYVSKTFVLGDVAFFAGAILFSGLAGTDSLTQGLLNLSHQPGAFMIGLLWLIAGITKTSNIPFTRWLPVTMNAPTPVSAMMHAGFVNAGGILFTRFAPLYSQQPLLLTLMFLIGSLTVVYGSLKMMVQTDIKRSLAYSTIGQMGFMIMQCGLGAFSVAMFHLIAHSLFKSSLFLGSGSVINDSKGIYLPEADSDVSSASRQLSPVWIAGLFILPVLITVILSRFIGISGAANLLWVFPVLPLLPLAKNITGHQLGMKTALLLALLIQLFYACSKVISHAIFGPDLHDAVVGISPLYLGVILLTVALLCYGISWKDRPSSLANWLYVRLLNQKTIFRHRRSRTALYD